MIIAKSLSLYYKIGFRVRNFTGKGKKMVITTEKLIGFNWITTNKTNLIIKLVGFRVSEILDEMEKNHDSED